MNRKFFALVTVVLLIVTAIAITNVTIALAETRDFFELHVPCRVGADVTVVMPDGDEIILGKVLRIPAKTNWPAYTASKWCDPATVCATAVNAIHMLVNVEAGDASNGEPRGRILSLVPAITVAPAAADGAFFALDMPAGERVFGGFAPLVGSRVTIQTSNSDNSERPLDGVPRQDEVLVIRSNLPRRPDTWMCDIENRPGGRVIAWRQNGPKVIARVIHPVLGVGRFGGTQFQERGRIRASHAGVIDVATAPRGEVGGIQIMPLVHALKSKEMASAWQLTQWMIVGTMTSDSNSDGLAGKEPLFKSAFVPGVQGDDCYLMPNIWSEYGRKSLVLCRINGGPWTHLPNAAGRVDDALIDVTHLRLYFPFWDGPQRNVTSVQ